MNDGGMQFWEQVGREQAMREDAIIKRMADRLVPFKIACELIMGDGVSNLEQAREQVKWAMEKTKEG